MGRATLLALMAVLWTGVGARAHAQSPAEEGMYELNVEGFYLHTDEVANGAGLAMPTDSLYLGGARADFTYSLGPSTSFLLHTPFLGYTRFGNAQQVSFPGVEMGARYFMAHAVDGDFAMTLHSAMTLRVPTVGQRRVGEIYEEGGTRSQAVTADGIFAITPHLGLTIQAGDLEIELEAAIAVRARMVNQLRTRAEVRRHFGERWMAEAAVRSQIAQDPRPDPPSGLPPLLSATGLGEFSESVALSVTVDYRLSDTYRLGGGIRVPIEQVEGPVSPVALATFSMGGNARRAMAYAPFRRASR